MNSTRVSTKSSIERMQSEGGIDGLISTLARRDVNIPYYAANALDELGWRPTADQAGAEYWITRKKFSKCVEIGAPAVDPLVLYIETERPISISRSPFEALGEIGDPSCVPALIYQLENGSLNFKEWSVRALGAIGDPRATKSLVKCLKEHTQYGPREAARDAVETRAET